MEPLPLGTRYTRMPWITAVGLRCPMPLGICPAGTIHARLASRPQPAALGNLGSTPAKIMPNRGKAHHSCCWLSTSHDPGTDSCAFR